MFTPIEIAKLYFGLSNDSNLNEIEKLFTNSTTYTSQTTGKYIGRTDIIAMQKAFHGKFSSLNWKVISSKEIEPGVILFDYEFNGTTKEGREIKSTGLEYITVSRGMIQDIKIQPNVA